MAAEHISLGDPAHEAERQAIRFLVQGLPDNYRVYSNAWLVERSGAAYELDTVVVAPHAVFIVELKSYRDTIEGNDHDWFVPDPMRSPIWLNHKTAQVMSSAMKRRSFDAGRVWVEGFVFLSHARKMLVSGPASSERLHTRDTICAAITDAQRLYARLPEAKKARVDDHIRKVVDEVLRGADQARRPKRRIRDYVLDAVLDHSERYTEHLVHHDVTGQNRVLRVYHYAPLAEEAERARCLERWKWEAQVLAKIGGHKNILKTDPPFADEAGLCLPFYYFRGLSLPTWVERYRAKAKGPASITAGVALWKKVAAAIKHANANGVIHRLLRPEVVLVEDKAENPDVRVTGFDLAKRPSSGQTILLSTVHDDRLILAAPEVIQSFTKAEARSDQYGLGVLLGMILAGRLLFASTAEMVQRGGLVTPLHNLNPYVPHSLDAAVAKMLSYRVEDRFPSIDAAVTAIEEAIGTRKGTGKVSVPPPQLDPDDIPKGTRLGPDYEVLDKIGAGGLATVYAARHLVSGGTRALKVAKAAEDAEEALREEHKNICKLDHPNIVRAVGDLTGIVPQRLTMVLERVEGKPLSRWLETEADPPIPTLRKYAEDLLNALVHLEEREVVHKDIKPDNLIVGERGLTLIDFSLAGLKAEDTLQGTPLYRDPALDRWTCGSDRYAAAMCLFELHTGRHPFGGEAPSPGDQPTIDDDELDQPGLADFFRKALDPHPAHRYASAVSLRAAYRDALGVEDEEGRVSIATNDLDPGAALRSTDLSDMAVRALHQAGVFTQGELVAIDPQVIRRLPGIGKKRARTILTFRRKLAERGVAPTSIPSKERKAAPLCEVLVGDTSPLARLGIQIRLADTLAGHGLTTVGQLAAMPPDALRSLSGVGQSKVAAVVEALDRFAEQVKARSQADQAATLGDVLDQVLKPLSSRQRGVVTASFEHAPGTEPIPQKALADELGITQSTVSRELGLGLETIDAVALNEVTALLEVVLDDAGGVERLDRVLAVLSDRWPGGDDTRSALIVLRLTGRVMATRLTLLEGIEGLPATSQSTLLVRPWFTHEVIDDFLQEARRLSESWPPLPVETAQRSLKQKLPEYQLDHLALAERICAAVRLLPSGGLVAWPVPAEKAIPLVLADARETITLEGLRRMVEETFGALDEGSWPGTDALGRILEGLPHCRVKGNEIVFELDEVRETPPRVTPDALPPDLLRAERSPAAIVGDLLRGAERTSGFRLVVTPPQSHHEIGQSVARALGPRAELVSFEQVLLSQAEGERFNALEEAELFGDCAYLAEQAERVIRELLEEKGGPGRVVVLSDTGALGVCDALHLVRMVYDETMSGARGLWVVVIPGVIHQKQPLFNEKTPVFHLDGATLPLNEEIPLEGGS